MRAVVVPLLAAAASVSLAAGASSSAPSVASTTARPSNSVATTAGATSGHPTLDRWDAAYSYLSTQTKATEIVCTWSKATGARPAPVPRPASFSSFSGSSAWRKHLITRNGPFPKGVFEDCIATVPTTVSCGPGIETFLGQFGLTFVADEVRSADLTPIEIAYAGQNAEDPDIIYRDEPGLFGLRIAL